MTILGYTHLYFTYDPDQKRKKARRDENKKAHPLVNPNPLLFQEDEVAYASTKQGGARGVRSIVDRKQNREHGLALWIAISNFRMKEDDVFDVVLIPKNKTPEPEPVPVGVNVFQFDEGRRRQAQRTAIVITTGYVILKTAEWISVPLTDGATLPIALSH